MSKRSIEQGKKNLAEARKKGTCVTPQSIEAGKRNIEEAREKRELPNGKIVSMKHGVRSYLEGNYMPPGLKEQLDAFESQIVVDLGESPTMAQRTLIANSRRALGVVILGYDWIEHNGLVDSTGEVAGVTKVLATFMNALRLNLVALGLQRKSKDVTDLDAIMTELSNAKG